MSAARGWALALAVLVLAPLTAWASTLNVVTISGGINPSPERSTATTPSSGSSLVMVSVPLLTTGAPGANVTLTSWTSPTAKLKLVTSTV